MPVTQAVIRLPDVIRRTPACVSAEIDGEAVLFDFNGGIYYSLDDIGTEIWRATHSPVAVSAICDNLAARYHADPAIIQADVIGLLDKLLARGAIRKGGDD